MNTICIIVDRRTPGEILCDTLEHWSFEATYEFSGSWTCQMIREIWCAIAECERHYARCMVAVGQCA